MTESYTLDLNNWLTQVLADGTHTYLYGTGRIAQYDAGGGKYFLGDALGSVRQLTDDVGVVEMSKNYQPYGKVLNSVGSGDSNYGFTGEWKDLSGMVYLRSRYYSPIIGRFLTKDSWQGDYNKPLTINQWNYVGSNPINFVDPSGKFFCVPGCCEEWVNSALVHLTVYGGPFSQDVVKKFNSMDRFFPIIISFTAQKTGNSIIPHVIFLPKDYINSNLPPPVNQIVHFAHETIHQTQRGMNRYSIWGEAQAYIYNGYIHWELDGNIPDRYQAIIKDAFDIDSPGYTTRDLPSLCKVREVLIKRIFDSWEYKVIPLWWDYLIFPKLASDYCEN